MKKIILSLLSIVVLFASCEKDKDLIISTLEITNEKLVPNPSSISVDCNLSTLATIKEAFVQYSIESKFTDASEVALVMNNGRYTAEIKGLTPSTLYYIRYRVANTYSSFTSEQISEAKTLSPTTPIVKTAETTDVSYTSAKVGGDVTDDGGEDVTERGVVYSTNQNPTTANSKVVSGSGKGTFTCNLTNLQEGTMYYVRAYAINSKGIAYGEEKSFTTNAITVPTVTTSSATNISYTSATVGGCVTDDGGANVTERGVVYSTSSNPTTANSKVVSGSGKGSFTCNLTNLQDGVTYYVRAYAINSKGTAYGEEKSFTTNAITVPTVTTSSATNISYTSATVGGCVTDDGGANVTERGVVYSTSSNPTTANSKVVSGSGKGSFTCNLTNLQDGVTYYVRAYAINSKGTAYGEEKSFTTKADALPSVTTSDVTNITYSSATVGGNVTNDGGANVTERGVVYSTSSNPTISNSKKRSGSGTGAYSVELSGLSEGTTYYVRAYAINSNGTSYGQQVSFTTAKHSTAKVRFQKTGDYYITQMFLLNEEGDVLADYWFGTSAGTSLYVEIPSGYAYPVVYDSWDENYYYMLDDPHHYYFNPGCKYTVQVTDDGAYYIYNVIKDGTFNLPAKVVATYKVHKNELRMQKKVKIE